MFMMLGVAVDTGNAAVKLPAADAHDAWSGCRHRQYRVERPAADAHDAWCGCGLWQCRRRTACR